MTPRLPEHHSSLAVFASPIEAVGEALTRIRENERERFYIVNRFGAWEVIHAPVRGKA